MVSLILACFSSYKYIVLSHIFHTLYRMQKLASGIAEVAVMHPSTEVSVASISEAAIKPLGPDFRAPTVGEAVAEVVSKVNLQLV
jgi:hypothetical protein